MSYVSFDFRGATRTSIVIYNGLGEKVVEHEVHESSNHWVS